MDQLACSGEYLDEAIVCPDEYPTIRGNSNSRYLILAYDVKHFVKLARHGIVNSEVFPGCQNYSPIRVVLGIQWVQILLFFQSSSSPTFKIH